MSTKDPLGLFPESRSPAPPAPASGLSWAVVGVLLGIALLLGYQRFGGDFSHGDDGGGKGDQQGQKDDQGHKKFSAQTIIFVHERNPQSIEHDLLLREMPSWCAANNIPGGFRALDDDVSDPPVPQLIQFAQTRGVNPPFVVATDSAGKPQRVISWPGSVDGLKELWR